MITRIWHGRTRSKDAAGYLEFLVKDGTNEYRETPGNRAAKIWKKADGDVCHFWTVTEWEDLEAVKAFAGDAHERAKYYPQDDGKLLEFEPYVEHYESFDVSTRRVMAYVQQLKSLFEGGSWQGEHFSAKLDDLTPDLAFRPPMPGVHSIAEIVAHCVYWRTVVVKHLEGDHEFRDRTVGALNFRSLEDLKQEGWPMLQRQFRETQSQLLSMLHQRNDDFLDTEYAPGFSFAYLLDGIVQHDVYHLGQIGLIRKMLALLGRAGDSPP